MTRTADMIHEDSLPGHESKLTPSPNGSPGTLDRTDWPGRPRSSRAPTAASVALWRHCSRARERTSL